MAKTTTEQINVRVDANVKRGAEMVLEDLGLNLSTAINVFLRKVYREGGIPFKVEVKDPYYSEENMAHIRAVAEKIDNDTAKLSEHELIEV